ncbi:MAG: transposase [Deltaproteobacteria bacterium]|nr:transposase [Deltaproteobacteria bacterium]
MACSPENPLPHVNRVVSLLKRWLLGTHQGRVSKKHLQHYLDEFVFRHNRRKSKDVGLLYHFRYLMQQIGALAKLLEASGVRLSNVSARVFIRSSR